MKDLLGWQNTTPVLALLCFVTIVSTGAVIAPDVPKGTLVEDCDIYCMTTVAACPDNPWNSHKADYEPEAAIELEDEGSHALCHNQPCWFWNNETGKHPYCEPNGRGVASRRELEKLKQVVEASDMPALKELIDESKGGYVINPERRSVQVAGCKETVIANYPLSEQQWAAFQDLK